MKIKHDERNERKKREKKPTHTPCTRDIASRASSCRHDGEKGSLRVLSALYTLQHLVDFFPYIMVVI